jgi:hypothetical protein
MFCFVNYTGVVINVASLDKSVNRHTLELIIHKPNTNKKNKETMLVMLQFFHKEGADDFKDFYKNEFPPRQTSKTTWIL